MEFDPDGTVRTERINLDYWSRRELNESLLLFFTGITRQAGSILDEQQRNIVDRLSILREMKKMAYVARDELKAGNLDIIGDLLHKSWELKKQLASGISNNMIDALYEQARQAGASGGKITGAGGGGFLLLYVPYHKRESVRSVMGSLQELPIQLEPDGSKVIFNYRR
jgi:D-glycero-alpha-D-manno-heptose-7-phosphate kinase